MHVSRQGCISMGNFDYGVESTDYFTKALAKALDAGIPVTLFYGKQDLACDYVGGEKMAMDLEWSGKDAFRRAELRELRLGRVRCNETKSVGVVRVQNGLS